MQIGLLCVSHILLSPLTVRYAHSQAAIVTRPDTLGAAFDHTKPGTASLSDYDFLLGAWSFSYQRRDPATGKYGPVQRGRWVAQRVKETLIVDEFHYLDGDGPQSSLMTYRVFNPENKQWAIQGVRVRRGVWQPGVSWSDGERRYVLQDNAERGVKLRVMYYDITHDRFLWRADGSTDGGQTWLRDLMLIEARRTSPR
jgi:hypothetical protein